jgi:hypothetical protein
VRGAQHNNLRNIARSAGSVTGQWLADHLSVLSARQPGAEPPARADERRPPGPARHECSGGSRLLLLLGTREMVLAITVLGSGIAAHDATVSIALPTIGRDFLTSLAARLWVMNGSTLTLAAFLLIGGRSATGSAGGRST